MGRLLMISANQQNYPNSVTSIYITGTTTDEQIIITGGTFIEAYYENTTNTHYTCNNVVFSDFSPLPHHTSSEVYGSYSSNSMSTNFKTMMDHFLPSVLWNRTCCLEMDG